MSRTRKRPAPPQNRPPRNATNDAHSTADAWIEPPTLVERREQQLLEELHSLGYGITVPCVDCGHPLTNPRSLASHIGPVCAARKRAVAQ